MLFETIFIFGAQIQAFLLTYKSEREKIKIGLDKNS